jgi:hypothetical protein
MTQIGRPRPVDMISVKHKADKGRAHEFPSRGPIPPSKITNNRSL